MNKLNDGIISCDNCGNDVEWYDYEIMSDEKGVLKIGYLGECPCCNKQYHWISTYHFIEMTYHEV